MARSRKILPDIEDGKHIGYNLKIIRLLLHYSQEDLAECIDSTQQLISFWENSRNIPIEHLEKFASLFEIEVNDIIEFNPKDEISVLNIIRKGRDKLLG